MYKLIFCLFFSFISNYLMAQNSWTGVCEHIELSYNLQLKVGETDIYTMKVGIKNNGEPSIINYCDVYASLTTDAYIAPGGNCYGIPLETDSTKYIKFDVDISSNPSLESFDLMFKVKSGSDDSKYCKEINRFWLGSALGLNEIDRSEMSFDLQYFDILGRRLNKAPLSGFYILHKTYEDGHQSIEKVYIDISK